MNLTETDLLSIQAKGLKIHNQYGTDTNKKQSKRHPSPNDPTQYSNRGMSLQHLVNRANDEYLSLGIAHIHEPGVPAKIIPDQAAPGGRKLIYTPATVDHLGAWRGLSIAFDDKATQTDELPAGNVKEHQVEFLLNHQKAGKAISFLLIGFTRSDLGRFFVVMIDVYFPIWVARRGLKVDQTARIGTEVFAGRVCLDYLRAIEQVLKLTG